MLFGLALSHSSLQGYDQFRPLFQIIPHQFSIENRQTTTRWTDLFDELFLALLGDQSVGVSHHGNQHVHQKNLHQDYEEHEHRSARRRVNSFGQRLKLKAKIK